MHNLMSYHKKAPLFGAGFLAVAFMTLATPVRAAEYNFGGVQIFVDTTLSGGLSVRTASRNTSGLPAANGGPREAYEANRTGTLMHSFGIITPNLGGGAFVAFLQPNDSLPSNYDSSINTDDGRLNFDKGDLQSGNIKMTNDVEMNWGRYTFFSRFTSFYDAILNTDSSYERYGPAFGAQHDTGRDIRILDAYFSGDFDIPAVDLPLNVRVGSQLINWGESTFYLNGINVANSIDVAAFRRPGSEIKEAFLPEWAAFFSMGLPYDMTVEGYYSLHWTAWKLEPGGSPFSTGDTPNPGQEIADRAYLSGSQRQGTFRRNCTGSPIRRVAENLMLPGPDNIPGNGDDVDPMLALPDLPGDAADQGSCAWAYAQTTALLADASGTYAAAQTAVTGFLTANTALATAQATLAMAQAALAADPTNAGLMTALTTAQTAAGTAAAAVGAAVGPYATAAAAYDAEFFNEAGTGIVDRLRASGQYYDYRVNLPVGRAEETLTAWDPTPDDTATDDRVRDLNFSPHYGTTKPDADGQFGIRLSWYSDTLNSTEFKFTYQNTHMKVPIAEFFAAEVPVVGVGPTGFTSGSGGSLNRVGCLGGVAPNAALGIGLANGVGVRGYLNTGEFEDPDLILTRDTRTVAGMPHQEALRMTLNPAQFGTATMTLGGRDVAGGAELLKWAAVADVILGAVSGANTWAAGTLAHGSAGSPTVVASLTTNGVNRYDVARINCAANAVQVAATAPVAALGFLAVNGAEHLTIQHRTALRFFFPKDLKVYGFSFNTTLGDWGIQGEVSYRPDQPLQVDTTEQIIHSAGNQCVGYAFGDASRGALTPLGTQPILDILGDFAGAEGSTTYPFGGDFATRGAPVINAVFTQRACNPELADEVQSQLIKPISFLEIDMLNVTIGTTALWTASTPFVDFLGADQAIFLSEFNMIYFPDDRFPRRRNPAPGASNYATLGAVCRSGSELPLGGILGLDARDGVCSPDKVSWGYTLLGILDYNNVFGTAWALRPIIAFNHSVEGNTPGPISTHREDRKSIALTLSASYQSTWTASIGYTNFFGRSFYNAANDRDFASFSMSYAF